MQDLERWKIDIHSHLKSFLNDALPADSFSDVINYSVFPTGKLFRPLIVYTLAQDLGLLNEDHKYLATAIELHHTYTLIHDDLPAMDDDDMRRGRQSSHKRFSESSAILAGDALINLSYQSLAHIKSPHLAKVIQLFAEALGAKGLILGQILDLENKSQSLDDIYNIHKLKTARLIQVCINATALLSDHSIKEGEGNTLAEKLGVNFQLLDDLLELSSELGEHEKAVNPFLKYDQDELIAQIITNQQDISQILEKEKLENLKMLLSSYFDSIQIKIASHQSEIQKTLKVHLFEELKNIKL